MTSNIRNLVYLVRPPSTAENASKLYTGDLESWRDNMTQSERPEHWVPIYLKDPF